MKYEMKPLFKQRMQSLLPDSKDFQNFEEIIHFSPKNWIRCNTLKINPEELFKKLSKKWSILRPFEEYPEIFLIESQLGPGELGSSIEHLLGYYYIQEISSMLSPLALDPKPNEFILDLCSSPGSKTTQIAAKMQNTGTLIANDFKMDRIRILASNLERCGVMNTIFSRNDGVHFCSNIKNSSFRFDKILLDVPCSGEGTLRSSPKTFIMWNHKVVRNLSRQQKKLLANALKCLKKGGTLLYSTCTHAPEENEEVIDFALTNFPVQLESIKIPLKYRPGIKEWGEKKFNPQVEKCARIYPQDNDSEGFFIAKMTLLDEIIDKEEK